MSLNTDSYPTAVAPSPPSQFFTAAEEAEISKAVYADMVTGALATLGLTKRGLALEQSIDERYLRLLLASDDLYKVPNERRAGAMLRLLPLPAEQVRDIKEALSRVRHHIRARERKRRFLLTDQSLTALVQELRDTHHRATFSSDLAQSRLNYTMVAEESHALLEQIDPEREPLLFVELSLVANDAFSVLHRPARALYHAKRAREITKMWEDGYRPGRAAWDLDGRIGQLIVNSIRASGVVHHNIGLHGRAERAAEEALAFMRRSRMDDFVLTTYTQIDQLHSLAGRSRFTFKSIDDIAKVVIRQCEGNDDPIVPLVYARALEAQARAYLAYGRTHGDLRGVRVRKTEALLRQAVEGLDQLPLIGPLHRATVFQTLAGWYQEVGDLAQRDKYLRDALNIAQGAALHHRIASMRRAHGKSVDALLSSS